ncbi:MAG: sulfatase-like hydrolase/transferase [Akkermansiaceae bacterium]
MIIKNILMYFMLVSAWSVLPAAGKEKPNIVMVFVDDMGWADLSCFGGKSVNTRNIDRLASEGLRFTNFYVNSPICSPSRVAITTGQYPQRWRITSYLEYRAKNRQRGMSDWLDPKAPVLARELRKAGYATGHFGKWHMGGQRDVGDAPLISEYGFDESLTNFEGLGPRVLPLSNAYDGKPPKKHDLDSSKLGHGPISWQDRSVITSTFVNGALSFINRAAAAGQPFFVNVWPDDPHSPFFPPQAKRNSNNKRDLYHAVLDSMDEQFAPLFDRIRNDPKLRDNTLVIIASDNGPETGAGSSGPLRGYKGYLHEGGIRSPLIVWGPAFLANGKAGTINDTAFLSSIDLNASLYQFTSIQPVARLDGETLIDTLLGKIETGRKSPLFFRRPPDRPGTADDPDLAVRDGIWKLVCAYDGSQSRLFDLKADPAESTDLSAAQPEITERLRIAVIDWNKTLPPDTSTAEPQKKGAENR